MTEREKTIQGLECCIIRHPDDKARCSQCPLYEATNCLNRLKNSALILLKPRLLTLEAVKRLKYGDVVYIEGIIGECFAAIVHDNVQHLGVLQTVSLPSDGVGNSDYRQEPDGHRGVVQGRAGGHERGGGGMR